MRKLFFGFMIVLLAWACNDDQMFEQQPVKEKAVAAALSRTTSSGLGVDKEVLYLRDDSVRLAGQIVISATVPEVTIQWNFPDDSCNVDTRRTHLAMKNGQATLDIKWDQILERGNFGPLATAFDGGVLISDGISSIYVHLIWTEEPVDMLVNKILTRSAVEASAMPKASGISLRPEEIRMNAVNGGTTRMKLTGVEYTYFQYDRIGAFTNISLLGLPEYIDGDTTCNLAFRWNAGSGAPKDNFKVPVYVVAEDEGINTTLTVLYRIAENDTLAVTPTELIVNPLGGTVFTTITTNDEKWTITSRNIPDWIVPSAREGSKGTSTVNFVVTQNTTMLDRTFTVYIETSSKSKGVIITQRGVIPSLAVTPQAFPGINFRGTTLSMNVTSNTDWTITSALPGWLTPDKHTGNGNATISFVIDANTAYQERTYALTIGTSGGADAPSQTVVFTQNAMAANTLEVSASATEISSQGRISILTITSNTKWSVSSSHNDWARVVDISGDGNGKSDINVYENTGTTERTAVITVVSTVGEPLITKTITIRQLGKNSTVNPGGDITIDDLGDEDVNVSGGEL